MNDHTTVNVNDAATPSTRSTIVTDPRRQRQILIAMCTALIAVVASVSGLNVAQQDLALDLGASQSQLLWIINGYTMALAALLLPIGAIGDRWGRKPILVGGLVAVRRWPTSMAGLADHDRHAAHRPHPGRRRGGDDHAGHAVGDHVELPAPSSGPGPSASGPASPAPAASSACSCRRS